MMTSLLDCQIFSLVKNFGWNMKKMVVGLAYWLDHLADQIWLATVFFQVFITPNYPKCEKNQLPVLPTIRQARPSTRLNFYQWRFFYFWIIWSWFGKKNSTKKTFELLFDNWWRHHARLILKFFWSKIFPKNDISNFLRSMSFLRSLSFFEIAVIF